MLPQPNFGPSKGPSKGPDDDKDGEAEAPPRQLRWLRIAMWVQTAFAVLAGNLLIVQLVALRQVPADELAEDRVDLYIDAGASPEEAAELATNDAVYFHGSTYLTSTLVLAGLMIVAAIVSALCAVRLKTRLKSVRRLGLAASIVLLLLAMLATMTGGQQLFLPLMLWVFSSVLSVWWLFVRDVKDWLSLSRPAGLDSSSD